MKRAALALLLIAGTGAAGFGCAELLYRSVAARELIARTFGRGELMAVVDGAGIYEGDGDDVAQLIVSANLRRESQGEQISDDEVEREIEMLRAQFGELKVFASELDASGLSLAELHTAVTEHLRARQWIEKQITRELSVSEEESRAFYEANQERFTQPARFRVSHLFLAAPAATPPEVIQAKGEEIKTLAKRLSKGEDFAALVAEASEDEATKDRGGDLRFFSATRMPADFDAQADKLQAGKTSAPLRLTLGYHMLQLTDTRAPRQMEFAEARGEIALHLTNTKRAAAVHRLRQRLTTAEFIRTPL